MDDERLAAKALASGGSGDPDAPELTEEELAAEKARKQRERDVLLGSAQRAGH